jgi:hypothetical protein
MQCHQFSLGKRGRCVRFHMLKIKKMMHRDFDGSPVVPALIVAVLITALAIELYIFARVQDIWLDESTQLSGIRLNFWDMLRWLAGADPDRLSVPADRMPPVSYLLDWLWLHLYGPSEIGFRLFHSALVIVGISWLASVVWRELGQLATIVTLGFLILSPKLIQAGVEIRAYPIFFAVTCAQTAVFIRLVACPVKIDLKLLALFTAICLVAIYTHYFGLVSSCAFFLALGISFLGSFAALAEIIGAFVVVAIGSLPLIPFVSAATHVPLFVPATATTATIRDENAVVQYLTYLLKLVGDSANIVSVSASILFFCGTIALLAASFVATVIRVRKRDLKPFDWLILVVVSGVFATILASFFVTFNPLTASYSIWLLAPLSLLIAAGATSITGFRSWDVAGRKVAVGALLVGAGISNYMFFVHASMFVHGPQRFVGALYDKTIGPKAIVYETGAAWGWSFIPLQFTHHGDVVQYWTPEGGDGLVKAGRLGIKATVEEMEAAVAPYQVLLLTDIRLRTYRDLRQCQNQPSACPDFPSGAIEAALIGTGTWRRAGKERSFGLYDSQVTILERAEKQLPNLISNQ